MSCIRFFETMNRDKSSTHLMGSTNEQTVIVAALPAAFRKSLSLVMEMLIPAAWAYRSYMYLPALGEI